MKPCSEDFGIDNSRGVHKSACSREFSGSQSAYICRVQSSGWRLPKYWPPTPSPPSECVLPPHQRRGIHTRRPVRGWGLNNWKTPDIGLASKKPDIGLASYSIIPLRSGSWCRERQGKKSWIVAELNQKVMLRSKDFKFFPGHLVETTNNYCIWTHIRWIAHAHTDERTLIIDWRTFHHDGKISPAW